MPFLKLYFIDSLAPLTQSTSRKFWRLKILQLLKIRSRRRTGGKIRKPNIWHSKNKERNYEKSGLVSINIPLLIEW